MNVERTFDTYVVTLAELCRSSVVGGNIIILLTPLWGFVFSTFLRSLHTDFFFILRIFLFILVSAAFHKADGRLGMLPVFFFKALP